MSDYAFFNTELDDVSQRLERCAFVLRTSPEDCASAEANLRHFLQDDLNQFYNRTNKERERYSEHEFAHLRERIARLQERRRALVEALPRPARRFA